MAFKKFSHDDVFHNTIVTYPEYEFFVYNRKTYINRESEKAGDFGNKINHVDQGNISLYEMNVNRPSESMIYPFITKDGARTAFRTVTTSQFQDSNQFNFGDQLNGSYPLSSSIGRIFVRSYANDNKKYLQSLRNPMTLGGYLSPLFDYDRINQTNANIIEIPSIFYGSQLRRGSVQLDHYMTGTLMAQLKDTKKNGELIETVGPNKGQVAGIVLYEYGVCILTSSLDLSADVTTKDNFFHPSTQVFPSWSSFATGLREVNHGPVASSAHNVGTNHSYMIKVQGTNKIPTMTLLTHAEKGELNYSINPTFTDHKDQKTTLISENGYVEKGNSIKNIVQSKYEGFQEDFESVTYISSIGIYDENKNLIAVAKLATPVKKTEARSLMLKLRLDF